jgi:hypothetical protein
MNQIMKRFMEEGYQSLFGSDVSWKKLFNNKVSLPSNYKYIIPYLMEIVNSRYRVIRFVENKKDVYAFVDIKNTKQTFSYHDFYLDMFLYRIDDKLEKKYGSTKNVKNID